MVRIVFMGLVSLAAIAALGGSASAAQTRARVGTTPPLPSGTRALGALPAATRLSLTIALQPRDPAGLQALATAVSTPGSPAFRHYLSVPEFASRFGASDLQIAAVKSALQAQGLDVGRVTANDLTLPVTGTAAQAEKAFSVSLHQVKLAGGRTAYTNAQVPTLPSSIAGYVQGVLGLDNVAVDQPAGLQRKGSAAAGAPLHPAPAASRPHVPTGGPQPCASATAQQANHGLTADEIATAYQFSSLYGAGDLGAGQTIAMFEEESYNPIDIATYQACYGTSASISNVDVAGGPTPGGDDGESALDIEQAMGLAPKANIVVYQGPFTATVQIISTIVSQNIAKVISSSYGLCETLTGGSTINAESPLLQEAAVQGQSFFISSGDSGSNMCYQATADQSAPDTSLSVIDPGGQPFATGVGGTSLVAGSPGAEVYYTPGAQPLESVWNDPSGTDGAGNPHASGSGGGRSAFFPMPTYQSSAPATLGVTNPNSSTSPCNAATFCREVPDVSADADPNTGYVIFSTSNGTPAWGITGGTSASAPLWAAFTALANASATCRGTTVGFVNPSLYQIAGSSYLNNFHDVTDASPFSGQANNDALYEFTVGNNPTNLFPLATGYDMATGLGSMIAPTLASSLCGLRAPVFTITVGNPGPQTATIGHPVSLGIHATDSGGAGLFYTATGLPPGLTINALNGAITGTVAALGSYGVTVAARDNDANAGSTVFTFNVVAPPPPPPPPKPKSSGVKLSGVGHGKPKLAFTIATKSSAAKLRSVSVSLPKGISFSSRSKNLAKGLVLKNGGAKVKYKQRLKHGVLTLSFKSSQRKVTVTLTRPAISVSRSLASKVRHHKVKRLTVLLRATDTANRTSRFSPTLKVS